MIHATRHRIPISKIRRAHGIERYHVEEIASSTRVKPPILVSASRTGKTFLVMDGHHRLEAARRAGQTHITAFVVPGQWRTAIVTCGLMSHDDLIRVRWRNRWVTYEDMRDDPENATIDRDAVTGALNLEVS